MPVSLTFDVEEDCPPYLTSTRGMEEGLPRILDLLAERGIRGTFFFTARMALKYPRLVKRVLEEGHELGCHAYDHERLDQLPRERAAELIRQALEVLRGFGEVISFRAPNLQLPRNLLPVLRENGILVDSSRAVYKGHWRVSREEGILELPVSVTSSVLRLPWSLQKPLHLFLREPRIYFAHPWEFVPIKGVRLDCRFHTGNTALRLLARLIDFYRQRKTPFLPLRDYLRLYPSSDPHRA